MVVLLSVFCVGFTGSPVAAQQGTVLKADTPKLDPGVTPRAGSAKAPLQARIEHNQRPRLVPRFSGAARRGPVLDTNALRSKLNQSMFDAQAQSSFGIIGVRFVLAAGQAPVINRVFPGTPAANVGIRLNDIIVAVDGVPTMGLSKEEVYDLIIGSPGTSVNLSIMRAGDVHVVPCMRMDVNEITDPMVRRDYMMSM